MTSSAPGPHSPVPRRARARDLDRRRLHRDRPRPHQRQPALGQQHADHQRRHALAVGHRHLLRPRRRRRRQRARSPAARRTPARSTALVAGGRRRGPGRRRPPRTPTSWSPATRPPTGTTSRSTPTSTCTTRSRPRWARRSAGAGDGGRVLYGFVNHELTTTYLGSSTGLRLRHVQPTGHYGCTGKTADLTQSAWVGGATRDFADVDAAGLRARRSRTRLGWGERRVDLPAGRYDTILPPTAVADLMIYAYWSAGARVAHEGQSVYSDRAGGTRHRPRRQRPRRHPLLRPGRTRASSCAPFVVASAVRQHVVGLRQRAPALPHRLDPQGRAHLADPDPALARR